MIPDILDSNSIPVFIFWHIFIDEKGYARGKNIIERQFKKIQSSGLLDRCQKLYIGYVSNLDFPCEYIIANKKVEIIVKADKGNEGVTTTALKKFCENNDGLTMYIHNRGISREEDSPAEDWTLTMEYFNIERWNYSIKLLEEKYTCGCEMWGCEMWEPPPLNKFIYHYSGNFWWARNEYIRLLKFPTFENRHMEGEFWILQLAEYGIPKEYFGILHRTSEERYKRGMVHGYIDRYPFEYYKSGGETPDIEIDKTKFHGENCTGQ